MDTVAMYVLHMDSVTMDTVAIYIWYCCIAHQTLIDGIYLLLVVNAAAAGGFMQPGVYTQP
jgi:hypothetical protein